MDVLWIYCNTILNNHLISMAHSEKLESIFLQFNIEVILLKNLKNKTVITLIFFIKDGIGQYIINNKHEHSQALLNHLYIKGWKCIWLLKTYQDTLDVYNSSLKLLS
jgi:hypothetical protein